MPPLHFVVPGALDQRTGGYIYDRRIVEGLRAIDYTVDVHELEGCFPEVDDEALHAAAIAAGSMGDGIPIIDGLALPAFKDVVDRLPRPWIGLIHHPLALETGLTQEEIAGYAALESRLMRQAEKLIVTSPRTKRDLLPFDVDPARVAVVEPGVEPADLATGSGDGDPKSLLCVGSLTRRKGYPVLIAALALLGDLDWHLTVVGSETWDPEHAAEIRGTVQELGLTGRIDLIGEQDEAELRSYYHQADLFVLASHHEGYGMVLAEALARGLPIVSTTAGAIPDTVPGAAGRLVPPGDAKALAAEIQGLLTDRTHYTRLKQGAEAARKALLDWNATTACFAREIETLALS